MKQTPSRVDDLIDKVLDCSILSCEVPTGGRIAETYILELSDDPWKAVCQIGGPSVRTGDVIEPLVVDFINRTTDLPVPEVYATGTFHGVSGYQQYWGLYEYCRGEPPTPFDSIGSHVRRQIVSEVGSFLGQLHKAHQYERIGGLGRSKSNLCIREPHGLNFPKQGRRLVSRHPNIADHNWVPVLSHGDLFPGNLLVDDDNTVTALLDWGNAQITTAGYALARAEMRFIDWFRFSSEEQKQLRGILRSNYEQHRTLPPDYPAFNKFYKSLWLAQSTDRVCRHLLSTRGRKQMKEHLQSLLF